MIPHHSPSMKNLQRRLDFLSRRARRGVSLLWIIIAFPALILFLVFAVEIGNIWLARLELEQSLEANALAAVKQWAETGGGDTLMAREVGNDFSIANPVRGQDVDLTDMVLNSAFTNGANRLNYDNSGVAANPNENLVCTDISDYDSYLQPGVMVFGAITQTENIGTPRESVVFNADVVPSCAGSSTVLVDATGQPNGNLGSGGNRNAWGFSFGAPNLDPVNPDTRISRIEYDVDPDSTNGFIFAPFTADGMAVFGVISDESISPPTGGPMAAIPDNVFYAGHLTESDVMFEVNPLDLSVLIITFGVGASEELYPGERFRFGASVLTGSSQVGSDGVGQGPGKTGTEITIFFNDSAGNPLPTESMRLVDTSETGSCSNSSFVDSEGIEHYNGSPSGITDLPCQHTNNPNGNGQSYVLGQFGSPLAFFAVRAQATIRVQSVVKTICGFDIGPWGVSAKSTAYYDCDTGDPKLIRVDVFECDPP